MKFFDSDFNEAPMSRLLQNTPAAFLVCGGPSINQLPLGYLNHRGVFSMAANNVAGHEGFKPSSFVCSDPPEKFHDGIWRDPTIMKFVPHPKLRRGRSVLRKKTSDGFEKLQISAPNCPNVWGFERRAWMVPDSSFFEGEAAWGNLQAGVDRTGEPKTVCTMLLGIRLLYELGCRCIYLLGVDFDMTPGSGYSFPQNRDEEAIRSNNSQFSVVNKWLCRMQKQDVFKNAGLEVFNCNPESMLKAFPFKPFALAARHCLSEFPDTPFDLRGWYEK